MSFLLGGFDKITYLCKKLKSLVIWNREKKKTNRIIVNLIN